MFRKILELWEVPALSYQMVTTLHSKWLFPPGVREVKRVNICLLGNGALLRALADICICIDEHTPPLTKIEFIPTLITQIYYYDCYQTRNELNLVMDKRRNSAQERWLKSLNVWCLNVKYEFNESWEPSVYQYNLFFLGKSSKFEMKP